MAAYGWDLTLAASHEFGVRARQIASNNTAALIDKLFNEQFERLSVDMLVEEMANAVHYDRNNRLLSAFISGFMSNCP